MHALVGSRFTRFALVGLAGLFLVPAAAWAQNYGGKGALLGGLGGAAAGAIIGNNNGKKAGTGAAIGAGVGALSGLLVGKAVESEVEKNRYQASAQTAAAYEQRALQARAGGVTPEDVISMTRAGLSEDVMSGQIRASGISRQLQVNDLIYLRNQGVPDGVIRTLQSTPVATGGSVNYTPSSYQVPTTVIAPAPAPVVVYEQVPVYRPYPYYYGPAWCPPSWHHGHHHHGHHHRGHGHGHSGVSWGISVGGH